MDRETKRVVNRINRARALTPYRRSEAMAKVYSSDGVPNRSGGSWPNHPSMRYELPIPFAPGADNVTDEYRDGHERIFGVAAPKQQFCPTCDKSLSWCECPKQTCRCATDYEPCDSPGCPGEGIGAT